MIANITRAAAAMLVEAQESRGLGVELHVPDSKHVAMELSTEGFGTVHLECEVHGRAAERPDYCRYCDRDGLRQVFVINDAGTNWLADSGKLV